MKTSTLLILAVLVLALFGYIYYSDLQTGGTGEEEKAGKKVMVFNADEVNRIEIQNPSGSILITKGDDGKWMLESPVRYPANTGAIETLLSDLEFSERLNTLSTKELGDYNKALESFGLKQPPLSIKIRTASGLQSLSLGNAAVSDNSYYALQNQNGKDTLMLVEKRLAEKLEQKANDWRNRSLATFLTPDVLSLTLKTERQQVEMNKEGNAWTIAKPLETPANPGKVNAYLAALLGTQVMEFVSDNASDLGTYGLNTPATTLDIKLTGDKTFTLKLGSKAEGQNTLYAQTSEWPVVLAIPAGAADSITNLLEQARERRLITLENRAKIASFRLENAGKALEFQASGGRWILPAYGNVQASPEETNGFLDQILKTEATNFLPPTESNLKRTGLTTPAAKIVFVETAENKPSDAQPETTAPAPKTHTLGIGQKNGANYFVHSDSLPFILEVPGDFYQKVISNKPDLKWFALKPALLKPSEVTGVVWTQGTETFSISQKPDGSWTCSDPALAVDTAFFTKQLSIASDFEAVKWIGPADPKTFAAASPFSLVFQSANETRTLRFGKPDKDGNVPACFDGIPFSFLMKEDDFQRLQLKPIETQKHAPGPASTPSP